VKLGVGTALTIYAFYMTYGLQINNCRNEDAVKTWRCIQHIQHMRVLRQYLSKVVFTTVRWNNSNAYLDL